MSYGVGLRNGVAFALGTIPSLTSGGGLRPSLLLDFLSGSLDPRITFSRGTQAMQYGSDGTLQYAPNNLLTYSNQADNAAWTKSNSFVQTNLLTFSDAAVANYTSISAQVVNTNPISGFTNSVAFPYTPSTNIIAYKSYTTVAGIIYTISAYVQMDDGGAPVVTTSPTAGDLTLVTENNPTPTNITVTSVGGGVYRVYASITALGGGTNTGIVKYNTQSARGFKVTGLQLVQGSVPGDYRATTSAALPVLYADYNGALRARKLCEGAAVSVEHYALQNSASTVAGTIHTGSWYVKAGERTSAQFRVYSVGAPIAQANFDALTNTISGISGGTWASASLGNGWYRVYSYIAIAGATGGVGAFTVSGGTTLYTGDGSSGIYIADAQLTPGYLPLAVTETTSAAVYGPRFDYNPSSLVTQNLLKYSEQFDNVTWTKTNVTVTANAALSPNGTMTADEIVCSANGLAYVEQLIGPYSQANSIVSVYLKASATDRGALVVLWDATDSNTIAELVVTSLSSGGTDAGNGWRRYNISGATLVLGNALSVRIYPDKNGTGVANVSRLYAWGANLSTGTALLSYAPTTSATVQTCAARGLLIEEQRTNLATFSNTFSDASWTVALGTKNVAASAVLSPESVANAWTLTDSSAVAFDGIQKSVAVAADGTTYTGSIFILKTSGGTSSTFGINFQITGGTTVTNNPRINTDTGAVLAGTATVTNAGLWWRVACSVTNNSSVGNTTLAMQLYPATAAYNSATDSAAATGSATIYGAQIETGAFATSYIPTVASTATRNADSASITTLTPWFNATQGTLYAAGSNFVPDADSTVRILATLTDTISLTNAVRLERVTNLWRDVQTVAGVASVASGTWTFGTNGKVVGAYQSSNSAATFNGATPTAVGTATMPSGITALGIGCNTSTGNSWNGWISSIRYYPTRLPNASLQSITV